MQRSIKNLMLISWIITILLLSGVYLFFFAYQKRAEFKTRSESLRENYILAARQRLAQVVDDVIQFADYENGTTDRNKLQQAALNTFQRMRFFEKDTGALFIMDQTGQVIYHPQSSKIGTQLTDFTDVRGGKPYAYLAKNVGERGDYYDFKAFNEKHNDYYKVLIFGKLLKKWQWIVCAEASLSPVEESIYIEKQLLKQSLIKDIAMMGCISLLLAVIAIALSLHFSNSLNRQIQLLLGFFRNPAASDNRITEDDFEFNELKFIGKSAIEMADQVMTLNLELQESLERTKKLALLSESANQQKSCFFANMSHELRSRMNAIMGMAELMNSTGISADQKKYIQSILHSSHSLLSLIKDISDFSTIEGGNMELKEEPFDLLNTLSEITAVFEEKADAKGLHFERKVDTNTPEFVCGDPLRLRQVLVHLIENALRFTQIGSVTMKVTSKQDSDTRTTVTFKIKDTGLGISDEKLKTLFDFATDTSHAARKFTAVSLGLSVSKQLVQLMGGELTADSGKNAGTTFTMTIPFELSSQEDVVKAKAEQDKLVVPLQTTEVIRTWNINVLLAEDDTINQSVTKLYLKRFGCQVDIANNGKEAVDLFKANNYNLILMDCEMPEMDGFAAVRAIRKLEDEGDRIPIIALTAHALKGDRTMCLNTGMDEHVVKPIDVTMIKTLLNKYFQQEKLENKLKN